MGTAQGFAMGTAAGAGVALLIALTVMGDGGAGLDPSTVPSGAPAATAASPETASLARLRELETQLETVRTDLEQRGIAVDALEQQLHARETEIAALLEQMATRGQIKTVPTKSEAELAKDAARKQQYDERRKRQRQLRAIANTLRRDDAPPEERAEALKKLLVEVESDDRRRQSEGMDALMGVADHLNAEEAAQLRRLYDGLAPDDTRAPAMAAIVGRSLHDQPGLGDFLSSLPRDHSPQIRRNVLRTLDRHPSDAYRRFVVELIRTDQDEGVLGTALDDDRILAAMSKKTAPALIEAIAMRLERGALKDDGRDRGEAYVGIALGAIHDPAASAAALERVATTEQHPPCKAFLDALITEIKSDNLSIVNLERIWKAHRKKLR